MPNRGAYDHAGDRSDRRRTVLARNKRDLAAATEIPATSAISLTELSYDCWILMMLRSAGRKRCIARVKRRPASFLA